jgi:hypothetical protein
MAAETKKILLRCVIGAGALRKRDAGYRKANAVISHPAYSGLNAAAPIAVRTVC